MKILLINDDVATAAALTKALTAANYLLDTIDDGRTALELVRTYDYDLLILDVAIASLDGISLCSQLRSEGYQLPILMLTAQGSSQDRILGLEAGADDYLSEPFDWEELSARIRALGRRRQRTLSEVLCWENLRLDLNTNNASYNGQPFHLTKKEYKLLELFLYRPQRIFSRSAILDYLWSSTDIPGEWAVTTHIKGLRQKLQAAGMKVDLIETIYGLGYRLRAEPKIDRHRQSFNQLKKFRTKQIKFNQHSRCLLIIDRDAERIAQLRKKAIDFDLQINVVADLAIASAQIQAHPPDVIVLNLAIADTYQIGGAFLAKLAQENAQIPVVVLEGHPASSEYAIDRLRHRLEIAKLGRYQVLSQPTSPDLLLQAATQVLNPKHSTNRKVTIVDDDPDTLEMLATLLEHCGLEVSTVQDLQHFWQTLEMAEPDLLILDVAMPNFSGLELCQIVRQDARWGELPILFLSGHTDDRTRKQAFALGADDYISKPIVADELFTRVLNRLERLHARRLRHDSNGVRVINLNRAKRAGLDNRYRA